MMRVGSLRKIVRTLWERGASDAIRRRLAVGAVWSVVATCFTRASALVVSIIVARALGKDHFGEFGVVQSTVGMFGLFAGAGMGMTATKHIAELRSSEPSRAGRIMGIALLVGGTMSALAAGVLTFVAPWLARVTLASTEVGPLLQLGCAFLIFGVMNGLLAGALYGFEGFRPVAIVDAIAGVAGCGMVSAGVLFMALPGAILGLTAAAALQFGGYWFFLRRELARSGIRVTCKGCLSELPTIYSFSLPALLASAMTAPLMWACSAVVVNQPDGYAQMGLFNAANQWRSAILLLPLTLSAPFLPVLASLFGADRRKYLKVVMLGIVVNCSLAFMVGTAVILLSRTILAAYGKDFVAGRPVLICLVASAVLAATVWSVGQAIASSGRMWWGFALNLVWGAVLLSSLWWLRRRGAYGYAVANLIAYAVHLFTSSAYVALYLRRGPAQQTGTTPHNEERRASDFLGGAFDTGSIAQG